MKTRILGEAIFELMQQLQQATSFAWPPFPGWDQLKDFQFVFDRLNGLFHFPFQEPRLAFTLVSADRALLPLQGWELPSTFREEGTPREGNLGSPFDDAFSELEQLAALSNKERWSC